VCSDPLTLHATRLWRPLGAHRKKSPERRHPRTRTPRARVAKVATRPGVNQKGGTPLDLVHTLKKLIRRGKTRAKTGLVPEEKGRDEKRHQTKRLSHTPAARTLTGWGPGVHGVALVGGRGPDAEVEVGGREGGLPHDGAGAPAGGAQINGGLDSPEWAAM